jgi:hypothetical protein
MTTVPESSIPTAPTPPSRPFHTLLVFRCPTDLSEALAAFAAQRGSTNISAVIRALLRDGLKAAKASERRHDASGMPARRTGWRHGKDVTTYHSPDARLRSGT